MIRAGYYSSRTTKRHMMRSDRNIDELHTLIRDTSRESRLGRHKAISEMSDSGETWETSDAIRRTVEELYGDNPPEHVKKMLRNHIYIGKKKSSYNELDKYFKDYKTPTRKEETDLVEKTKLVDNDKDDDNLVSYK